ncbi:hypothetical protein EW146_g10046, partial [Bondarzewia mesenterica]
MYYYLSFLRPPPLQSSLSAPLTITPQVSNDLRTEPFPDPIDIYYFWSPRPPLPPDRPHQTPQNLTTWRASNAYKPLTVPPPPRARDGAQFCLVLTTLPSATAQCPSTIDLHAPTLGSSPLPVSSLPILFTKDIPSGKVAKQESILRSFCLSEVGGSPLLRKLWDSGIGLGSWLTELRDIDDGEVRDPLVKRVKATLFQKETCDVIELGAGTGIVSLVLAALRSSSESTPEDHRTRILTTDLPSSIHLMTHNITQNKSLFPH